MGPGQRQRQGAGEIARRHTSGPGERAQEPLPAADRRAAFRFLAWRRREVGAGWGPEGYVGPSKGPAEALRRPAFLRRVRDHRRHHAAQEARDVTLLASTGAPPAHIGGASPIALDRKAKTPCCALTKRASFFRPATGEQCMRLIGSRSTFPIAHL